MLTMTLSTHTGAMQLALAGKVSVKALPEIKRFIRYGRQVHLRVSLDLSEVTLIDRQTAQFLTEQMERGVELVNCPVYIMQWILRDTTHEPDN